MKLLPQISEDADDGHRNCPFDREPQRSLLRHSPHDTLDTFPTEAPGIVALAVADRQPTGAIWMQKDFQVDGRGFRRELREVDVEADHAIAGLRQYSVVPEWRLSVQSRPHFLAV